MATVPDALKPLEMTAVRPSRTLEGLCNWPSYTLRICGDAALAKSHERRPTKSCLNLFICVFQKYTVGPHSVTLFIFLAFAGQAAPRPATVLAPLSGLPRVCSFRPRWLRPSQHAPCWLLSPLGHFFTSSNAHWRRQPSRLKRLCHGRHFFVAHWEARASAFLTYPTHPRRLGTSRNPSTQPDEMPPK